MIIQPETLTLKDGRKVVLRTAEPEDAIPMIHFLQQIARETHFLMRYPEEVLTDVAQEEMLLTSVRDDPRAVMLAACVGTEVVGNVSIRPVGARLKNRHRAGLGISVLRSHWGVGLGSALMDRVLHHARALGYEQVELAVFSDNERAIRLYERYGFRPFGTIPRAFKLKDGTYRDDIQMFLPLN